METESNGMRLAYLRVVVLGRRYLADAGLDDTGAQIAFCLIGRRKLWSIKAISDDTGLSRVTVRAWLYAAQAEQMVTRFPRGFRLTQSGREEVEHRVDEAVRRSRAPLAKLRDRLTES